MSAQHVSAAQHTPGPWKAGAKGISFPDLRSWLIVPVGTREDQIAQDDLRLIAAAPALLEALEGCLGYFEDMKNAGVNAVYCMPDEARLAPVRAAIAQAKGDQP